MSLVSRWQAHHFDGRTWVMLTGAGATSWRLSDLEVEDSCLGIAGESGGGCGS
jgi:hypothetical protein